MILGLFGGVTKKDLIRSLDRIESYKSRLLEYHATHKDQLNRALADREAAIRQLRDEILDISELQSEG